MLSELAECSERLLLWILAAGVGIHLTIWPDGKLQNISMLLPTHPDKLTPRAGLVVNEGGLYYPVMLPPLPGHLSDPDLPSPAVLLPGLQARTVDYKVRSETYKTVHGRRGELT